MTAPSIRPYEPTDADAVWSLHERALRDAGAFDPELTHLDADLRRIEEAYTDVGGTFLVGEADDAIRAMGAVRPLSAPPIHDESFLEAGHAAHVDDPDHAAALKRMRVDPEYYRQGFGSALLAELEAWARDRFDSLVLDTTTTQGAAVAFYETHDYRRVDRETTDHGTVLFYRKRL